MARIATHTFVHGCFFETDGWLLAAAGAALADVPTVIVHVE
jgi:hypothetical protein